MNEMILFSNPQFGDIRTIEEDGKVLFCGADVAKALGYVRPNDAISAHCRGTVKRRTGVKTGVKADGTDAMQTIEMLFITEGDIYRLAARSKLEGADEFERWIFDEVLPSIRRNGGYIQTTPEMTPEEIMAKALLLANATIESQKAKLGEMATRNSALTVENQIMQPKAEYFDQLVDRNLLTGLYETAKELGYAPKKFVKFLLEKKYLFRDKRGKPAPYQAHVDNGLFELKECFNEKTQWSGTQVMVTPKGRETFRLLGCEC